MIGELDPDGVRRRHERQKTERCVEWEPCGDGMGWMNLYGPAQDLAAAYTAINDQALAKPRAGDESPMGVLRFDAAIGCHRPRHSAVSAGRWSGSPCRPRPCSASRIPPATSTVPARAAHVARRLAAGADTGNGS